MPRPRVLGAGTKGFYGLLFIQLVREVWSVSGIVVSYYMCISSVIIINVIGASLYLYGTMKEDYKAREFGIYILGFGLMVLIPLILDIFFGIRI